MSVLIIKCSALGDVLRTTALLPALRKRYGGPIVWLTHRAALPLLKGHPDLNLAVGSPIRLRGKFDLALSLEENLVCAQAASAHCRGKLVGVTIKDGRLSYTPSSDPYYGMSLLRPAELGGKPRADELKVANRKTYAELWLSILGLSKALERSSPRPRLFLSDFDRAAARELERRGLKKGKAIGLNFGAGERWPAKGLEWDAAVKLARSLSELGRPLLLLGGRAELEFNQRLGASLPRGSVWTHRPVGLRGFAALVEHCGAVVSTDTLAVHMAAAVSRPVVCLVGPTSASELDLGKGCVLTPPRGCSCFYQARCRLKSPCLSQISPEKIVSALKKWL